MNKSYYLKIFKPQKMFIGPIPSNIFIPSESDFYTAFLGEHKSREAALDTVRDYMTASQLGEDDCALIEVSHTVIPLEDI